MACLPLVQRLRAVVALPEWRRLQASARAGDPPPPEVVRDWLLDLDIEVTLPAPSPPPGPAGPGIGA
jgi:hypothetical protein